MYLEYHGGGMTKPKLKKITKTIPRTGKFKAQEKDDERTKLRRAQLIYLSKASWVLL